MLAIIPPATTTVLWDLDGTLIDSFGIFCDVLGTVLPLFDRQLPESRIIAQNFHGSLKESIGGGLGLEPGQELDAIATAFLAEQDRHYEVVEHHLYNDALTIAEAGAGRKLRQVIVTNREHAGRQLASPRSIVARSSLKDCITEIICADDCEHRKPNPAVLDFLASPIDRGTTIMIGDQHVDAAFARNLGVQAIIVNRQGPDKRLEEFEPEIASGQFQIVATLADVQFAE